jgi:hypothetical protein
LNAECCLEEQSIFEWVFTLVRNWSEPASQLFADARGFSGATEAA